MHSLTHEYEETEMIPQNYEQWRRCITVECDLLLTETFIAQRLQVWRNTQLEETSRFRRLYGDNHWRAVLGWFEQAEKEVRLPD